MFNSEKILNEAEFKIKELNGFECYKKSNNRFYHCFINQNESFNKDAKWYRISKSEYENALRNYNYLSSVNG